MNGKADYSCYKKVWMEVDFRKKALLNKCSQVSTCT